MNSSLFQTFTFARRGSIGLRVHPLENGRRGGIAAVSFLFSAKTVAQSRSRTFSRGRTCREEEAPQPLHPSEGIEPSEPRPRGTLPRVRFARQGAHDAQLSDVGTAPETYAGTARREAIQRGRYSEYAAGAIGRTS